MYRRMSTKSVVTVDFFPNKPERKERSIPYIFFVYFLCLDTVFQFLFVSVPIFVAFSPKILKSVSPYFF